MKKLFFALALLLCFSVRGNAQQTWTYVQESVITYCANNTSSCGSFGGTMIPTRSDTVWIFGISTTTDNTGVTVTGGGATWTECTACTTFLSGFRRNRVYYAIGGTAGSTNFSITLQNPVGGNSGSAFAVTFVEILPPLGTTASFDTGGATSSSTCTGTCTGVGLTLTATDTVVQFMNRIAPADYKGWPSPYQTLPNGDGLHLNAAAGTETAPVVNVASGTGAVFSAIAFKSTAGSFSPPATGPISLVSFTDPDPASGLTGLNCAPSCTLTLSTATSAGHLFYLEAANVSGTFISSVTGGGTWVIPTGCRISGGQAAGNSLSCAYVLSSTGTVSSLNITMTGNASTQFAFYEMATSVGSFSFDVLGTATNAASLNPSGVSLSLGAGGTDVVFASISVFGGTSSLSFYPLIRGCRSGCGPQFWNGQAASDAIMNVAGGTTAPVPRWANQQNNATVVSGVAFKSATTTINAASCSSTDVQSALNSVNTDNTTVVLPVCLPAANVQWASTVTYNQPFSLVLQGQGSVSSSDSFGNPTAFNDQTAVCDLVSNAGLPALSISTTANKSFRMTGVSFLYQCGQATSRNVGYVSVSGNSHSFRFDHNHMNSGVGFRALNIASGNVLGVVDHNLFDMANGTNVNQVEVIGYNWNGTGDSWGDSSWNDVSGFGSGNFLFFENNSFLSSFSSGATAFDLLGGARAVFRFNTFLNTRTQGHGIGSGDGRSRGPRAWEFYKNAMTYPLGPYAQMMDYEGGTSIYWGNNVSGFNDFINFDLRRATGFTYNTAQPPNGFGFCGSLQTGGFGPGPSVWDQNTNTTGWGCLDGNGRGKGDLLSGVFPNTTNSALSAAVWPRQVLEPAYIWANTFTSGTYLSNNQNDQSSVSNRDYYGEIPNVNNPATFNGTVGIGNGTLTPSTAGAYTNAPACTNFVGYWQSTTQTFFQCQATWGTMDQWFPFSTGPVNSVITAGTLTSGSIGPTTSWTLNPATPTGLTFAVSQGDMGGSITVAGTTYPYGTATQAVALNDANNFTYATGTGGFNGKTQVVANGFLTVGAANAGFNGQFWDLVLLQDNVASPPAFAVLQLNNGQPCFCLHIEANPAGITTRSADIPITAGHRYSFSFFYDEVGAHAQLAIFDPSLGYAQVCANSGPCTASVTQNTTGIGGVGWFRFGNAETGTSTGTTFFENIMLDWTNHTFPNKPSTSWVSYYQPFSYPHPLVGPSLSFNPNPVAFGGQLLATTSPFMTLTVTNIGAASLTLSNPYFTITGANAGDFTNTGTGTCVNGGTINSNASCTVILSFTPSVVGPESATLNINGTVSGSVGLSGTGVSPLGVAPAVSIIARR